MLLIRLVPSGKVPQRIPLNKIEVGVVVNFLSRLAAAPSASSSRHDQGASVASSTKLVAAPDNLAGRRSFCERLRPADGCRGRPARRTLEACIRRKAVRQTVRQTCLTRTGLANTFSQIFARGWHYAAGNPPSVQALPRANFYRGVLEIGNRRCSRSS